MKGSYDKPKIKPCKVQRTHLGLYAGDNVEQNHLTNPTYLLLGAQQRNFPQSTTKTLIPNLTNNTTSEPPYNPHLTLSNPLPLKTIRAYDRIKLKTKPHLHCSPRLRKPVPHLKNKCMRLHHRR